jgi:hypothetical protein
VIERVLAEYAFLRASDGNESRPLLLAAGDLDRGRSIAHHGLP